MLGNTNIVTSSPTTNEPSRDKYKIRIYYQNVRGLNSKTREIYDNTSLLYNDYDIFALTETWLTPGVSDGELFYHDYTILRCDRNFAALDVSKGGGVLLACKSSLMVSRISLEHSEYFSQLPMIDILIAKIGKGHKHWYVILVYIPPKVTYEQLNLFVEGIISLEFLYGPEIIFLGDFNVSDFNSGITSPSVTCLKELTNFFSFSQYNNILNSRERMLDLVFSTLTTCFVSDPATYVTHADAHHPPLKISVTLECDTQNYIGCSDVKSYNFRKADFVALYSEILNIDWSILKEYNNVNEACDYLYKVLYSVFDHCVPLTCPNRNSRNYPPWFNREIIRNVKKKQKLYNLYKKSKDPATYASFSELRTKLKNDIATAHKNFLINTEDNIKNEPKKFWSYLSNKRKHKCTPLNMKFQDELLDNGNTIVEGFAEFFKKAYASDVDDGAFAELLRGDIVNSVLNINFVTDEDILRSIKKLKSNMTMGPDNIPALLIRDCASTLVEPLKIIFNLIISTSTIPEIWKISRICPVFKSGDINDIGNYRPITIICNFSKVLEFFVHEILYSHVKNIISVNQHGFMKGRSTTTNLVCITQYISEVLDDQGQVDVVYTDFSKAFDRLLHSILLQELTYCGLSPNLINLFRSYLSGRSQYVCYRGFMSCKFQVMSGVPQGSILGPLLFNIFIDNAMKSLNVPHLLYADDMKIYIRIRDIHDCIILQENIDRLNLWCKLNKLPLNISKCNILTYSRKKDILNFPYNIDNVLLNRPEYIKDLGVFFDSQLTFTHHIDYVILSANKNLGFIMRNSRDFCNICTLKLLYNSFVRSRLEYNSIIWSPNYVKYIEVLERVQRRFLKYLSYKENNVYPPIGYSHNMLLENYNYKSLLVRRNMHSVIFLFKVINFDFDSTEILHKINFNVPTTSMRRQCETFYLKTAKTNILHYSPLHIMCRNYSTVQDSLDIYNSSVIKIKNTFLK